jgi:hypothetical protein
MKCNTHLCSCPCDGDNNCEILYTVTAEERAHVLQYSDTRSKFLFCGVAYLGGRDVHRFIPTDFTTP